MKMHEFYMDEALKEAAKAFEKGEVPVGAVIVYQKKIIGRAHNQIRLLKDPTAHAEMIAITQAANYLGNERLNNCDIYATLEPCPMCMGALVLARVKNLVYAAKDPKTGACGSVMDIGSDNKLNHRVNIKSGVLEEKSALLMQNFFKERRREKAEWTLLKAGGRRGRI